MVNTDTTPDNGSKPSQLPEGTMSSEEAGAIVAKNTTHQNGHEYVTIKRTQLEMMLQSAGAYGYKSQTAGMYPFNWQDPQAGEYARIRQEKLAAEKQVQNLMFENGELKREMESRDEKWQTKLAEKDLTILNMHDIVIRHQVEGSKKKKTAVKRKNSMATAARGPAKIADI